MLLGHRGEPWFCCLMKSISFGLEHENWTGQSHHKEEMEMNSSKWRKQKPRVTSTIEEVVKGHQLLWVPLNTSAMPQAGWDTNPKTWLSVSKAFTSLLWLRYLDKYHLQDKIKKPDNPSSLQSQDPVNLPCDAEVLFDSSCILNKIHTCRGGRVVHILQDRENGTTYPAHSAQKQ